MEILIAYFGFGTVFGILLHIAFDKIIKDSRKLKGKYNETPPPRSETG